MISDQLTIEARRIIKLLKTEFLLPDGAFFLERIDRQVVAKHIYPDLGDFVPFFLYFSERDFVARQIDLFQQSLVNGVMISEFPSFKLSGLVKSYEYTDLLLGLLDWDNYEHSAASRQLLLSLANSSVQIFKLDSRISSFYHQPSDLSLPLLDTRDGTLIELFCDLNQVTGDKKYLSMAENIFIQLTTLPFYQQYRLMPTFSAPTWFRLATGVLWKEQRFTEATICKNTTNSLFGFLALAQTGSTAADEAIKQTVAALRDFINEIGGLPMKFCPGQSLGPANLTASFPLVDFLCDYYYYRRQPADLKLACQLADFWLSQQGQTGLFPVVAGSRESFFDSETDMTVALNKLWEISGNQKYKLAADRCLAGILKYHGQADYSLSVDIHTGEVINRAQRTKFLALFLKLLILEIEYARGRRIYNHPDLHQLLKDR